MDGNAQIGVARMIVMIGQFVLKSSRRVFKNLCLDFSGRVSVSFSWLSTSAYSSYLKPQHSPMVVLCKASISCSFCKSNPIQSNLYSEVSSTKVVMLHEFQCVAIFNF